MSHIGDLIQQHCSDGVPYKALGEVGTWTGGGTPSKANRAYWDEGTIPWLSPKKIWVGRRLRTRRTI